jgi:hypothetical protein
MTDTNTTQFYHTYFLQCYENLFGYFFSVNILTHKFNYIFVPLYSRLLESVFCHEQPILGGFLLYREVFANSKNEILRCRSASQFAVKNVSTTIDMKVYAI